MRNADKYALDAAKEITIACISNGCKLSLDGEDGKFVADFFETVYNRIREIAVATNDT